MHSKETHLQQMLTQLRTRLLVMFAAVGIALDEALQALTNSNTGKAQAVIDGDDLINAKENEIDELALLILVRNQPVAHDLRFVVASLRMVGELERIGDEAVDIAERACQLNTPIPAEIQKAMHPLIKTAREMFAAATELFRQPNADNALELSRGAPESNQMEINALQLIMEDLSRAESASASGTCTPCCVHTQCILITRALNRVCRRAVNLAEQIYFIEEGVNIKHLPGTEE